MERNSKIRFFPVIIICLGFILLAAALIGHQFYGAYTPEEPRVELLPNDIFQLKGTTSNTERDAECLVLINSTEADSVLAKEDIRCLFEQLHADADFIDE